MAKNCGRRKKAFWEGVALRMVMIANWLQQSNRYIIVVQTTAIDTEEPDSGHTFSQREVANLLLAWRVNANETLNKLMKNIQANERLTFVFSNNTVKKVLPSREEIRLMVQAVYGEYHRKISNFTTQEDFETLKDCMLPDALDDLQDLIKARIHLYRECCAQERLSMKFLEELQFLRKNLKEWVSLVPVRAEKEFENKLTTLLDDISIHWGKYLKEKSISNLNDFCIKIDSHRKVINFMLNKLYPEEGTFEYTDLPYMIMGAYMARKDRALAICEQKSQEAA